VVEIIQKHVGEKVFKTYIRENVALAEAPAQRKDIFEYSPKSSGAQDYLELCHEILARIESGATSAPAVEPTREQEA
jgi:chromosome partitioning protein